MQYGSTLKPSRISLRGRFDQADRIGLQRVVVADQFELDPLGLEDFARHMRGGHRFVDGLAARRIRQQRDAVALEHVEEAGFAVRSIWRRSATVTMPGLAASIESDSDCSDG